MHLVTLVGLTGYAGLKILAYRKASSELCFFSGALSASVSLGWV